MSPNSTCINCERTDQEVPILSVTFKGEPVSICTSCLPVMIHKPQNLAPKLPGAEEIGPGGHHH